MEKSLAKCRESVKKIDKGEEGRQGYVDLFLIHSPSGGPEARKEMWLALEKLVEEGGAKSIGVSNFGVSHIEELKGYAKIWPPHVNQIEVSGHTLFTLLRSHPRHVRVSQSRASWGPRFLVVRFEY